MRGHVRKRGKKWCIVVHLGVDENTGQYKYKWFSGYDTKRSAEADLPAKLQEVQSGMDVTNKETVASFLMRWAEYKSTQVRPNTLRSYMQPIRNHIIPRLGKIELTKLTPKHLQSLYTKMLTGDKPLSNRTVQLTHVIIHDALDRALKWGIVTRNVADAVDAPRPERKETQVWSLEEAMTFLRANEDAEPRTWIGFYLAIMTGMRKGEIMALRWSDIDWERGFLSVSQTLTWVGGKPIIQNPKTSRSRRSIALFDDVVARLKKHRARQNEDKLVAKSAYDDHDLIIARATGAPMNPRTFDDAWYRSLKRADVSHIRFHDLRHTHATLLLAQDVHLKIVSERLGHSTVSITADLYSHVLPGMQKRAAEQFGDAVKKTGL